MNNEKQQLVKRILVFCLIVFNAVIFCSCLSSLSDGYDINWGIFFLIVFILNGIPLLVYLCMYIILWSDFDTKQKSLYSFISIALSLIILILFISLSGANSCSGNDSDGTKRCNSCYRTFEERDAWGYYSDDYNSILRTGMCVRCYENYKWTHGK